MDLAARPGAPPHRGAGRYGGGAGQHDRDRPLDLPSVGAPNIKADPAAQRTLLEVQQLDSRADALGHQIRTLPEKQQLAEAETRRRELDDRARDLRIASDDLTADQKRADRDVEQVRTRRERDQGRIDAGQVTNPKDLERMTHELESLERRISTLEDEELEVMARLEDVQLDLRQVTEELAGVDQHLEALRATRDEKLAVLDNDLTAVRSERSAIAGGLPDDLSALYEKLRAAKGGVAASELRRGECGGCRLSLNAADLRDIAAAPADEVIRCEECQRILVRTSESGL